MIPKIIVIRPGALGDVLAARGALRWLKQTFPSHEVELVAPGERGRLLLSPGWADACRDWERSIFSWLFSDGTEPPPPELEQAFAPARLIVTYMNFSDADAGADFAERLRTVAPEAEIFLFPSAPPEGVRENIVSWLCGRAGEAAREWKRRRGGGSDSPYPDAALCQSARIPVEPAEGGFAGSGRYAVLHPGSGGAKKNWPAGNFIFLGEKLRRAGFGLLVTSGEADGGIGRVVAGGVADSVHLFQPELRELAAALSGAALYVGNDSGVSHLASSVMTSGGAFPASAVIFGPTDSAVWSPLGSLILPAGRDMGAFPAEAAWRRLLVAFPFLLSAISE